MRTGERRRTGSGHGSQRIMLQFVVVCNDQSIAAVFGNNIDGAWDWIFSLPAVVRSNSTRADASLQRYRTGRMLREASKRFTLHFEGEVARPAKNADAKVG